MVYEPKVILVTGAAGFIGSNFVRMMLSRYDNIRIISYDKLTYSGSLCNLSGLDSDANHQFIQGDILDQDKVLELLRLHQVDTLVHFAAESHVDNSIAGPEVFFKTNVMGTVALLEAAKQYWLEDKSWGQSQCRFHHVSTDEVYGTLGPDDPPFSETTPYAPNSPYSASKAGSDHAVRSYFHTYQLPMTISNCSNNYGPYQHAEKLIPVVVKGCMDQKSISVYGDGSNIRDWLYVEDHCDAIDCILRKGKPGEVYNVGGNHEMDNLSLVKAICQQMDVKRPENFPHERLIRFVKDRQGHDWRYAIDNSKIQSELGWKTSSQFVFFIDQCIDFYLN